MDDRKKPEFWRSLEELHDTPEFRANAHREFASDVDRRMFLKLLGASVAVAGVSGCEMIADEVLAPYVEQPPEVTPGNPLYFATAVARDGYARGVVVTSHTGRPTKIEGNPMHPASLGATDAVTQAMLLDLYDPDRSQAVARHGNVSTWNAFVAEFNGALALEGGLGLRILTRTVTSPTLSAQLGQLLKKYPGTRWHQYEPVGRDGARQAAQLGFGKNLGVRYRFEKARVIVSLDCDFLFQGPGALRYARDFIDQRQVVDDGRRPASHAMNRLYVVESTPTITGAIADHRLPLRSSAIASFALAFARAAGFEVGQAESAVEKQLREHYGQWLRAMVADLARHRGAGLVLAGDQQPAQVHLLAHALNQHWGNAGAGLPAELTEAVEFRPAGAPASDAESLSQLVTDMRAGKVTTLLILGGNPVYDAPADLHFARALSKVRRSMHQSLYEDETSAACEWHVPASHILESWTDLRAYDGTATVAQPLLVPLYGTHTVHELLAVLQGELAEGDKIVKAHWQSQLSGRAADFETHWRKSLHDGVVAGTALPALNIKLKQGWQRGLKPVEATTGVEIIFRPDPHIGDGAFSNNAWLQELPKPMLKTTWENVVLMSQELATAHGFHDRDLLELRLDSRAVRAPLVIAPGHASNCVTVTLGYGRRRAGRVATGIGYDAYELRSAAQPNFAGGLELGKVSEDYALASTQLQQTMEGRAQVRTGTLSQFLRDPESCVKIDEPHDELRPVSLYPDYPYSLPIARPAYAWGMAVNLNACIGCNACVAACQAENNSPVVGKDEVRRGRQMHWLRVDTYYRGDVRNPEIFFQPVPCMHCEKAPCEVVCPVMATTHSDEGLNEMTYNRCVGTRYCSNNCPYKVRRFNFFQYVDDETEILKARRNPDVSPRTRGVMEKCTYCVQRITAGRILAEREGRQLRDGEVRTACQQACPTEAILFGNINDQKTRVSRLKSSPLNYGLLA
ncbi:MAG: TAT-variant-translocated molybdopterin oxidoreductase, partial [Deltaproteobacteria bacterium]|nr:TAT-variant-translocated molybdopterin oxidoreductase [Deltaproteobacteria bacterium]